MIKGSHAALSCSHQRTDTKKTMTTQPNDAKDLKGKTGLRRLINAFHYSQDGFMAAYKNEEAFRQEFWLLIAAVILAMLLPFSMTGVAAVAIAHLFLLIVEILNSAIEAAIDRIGSEIHPLSKRAKDMGSCAVLMAIAVVVITWLTLLVDAFIF